MKYKVVKVLRGLVKSTDQSQRVKNQICVVVFEGSVKTYSKERNGKLTQGNALILHCKYLPFYGKTGDRRSFKAAVKEKA